MARAATSASCSSSTTCCRCSRRGKNVELPLLLTRFGAAQRSSNAGVALSWSAWRTAPRTSRASFPADSSSASPSRAPSSRTRRCWCATSPPATSTASRPRKSALLQQLNRDHGKTIIMVTHDPKAAEFAHHTLHLDKGTLVETARSRPRRHEIPAPGLGGAVAAQDAHAVHAAVGARGVPAVRPAGFGAQRVCERRQQRRRRRPSA